MRALVTGGSGFIGSHIVQRLVENGHKVRVVDDFSTGKRENLDPVARDVEIITGDVRDRAAMDKHAAGCEVIFHQAAVVSVPYSVEHPEETHAVNIMGTLNVLMAARKHGVRRVVFASSAAVYGDEPTLPKRESMTPDPISPYGVEKLTSEHYLRAFSRLYGLETVALRYFNVFGPRQDPSSPYSGVISVFVNRILEGKPVDIFGDGKQSRDFVYVANVVDANISAATTSGVSGRVYNIACGGRTTLVELADAIGHAAGTKVTKRFGEPRPGDIKESLADVSRARTELGYAPRVSIEEGLKNLVSYARNTART
ncbi:UDP-glucose 4-epimerase [Labilithrix luteola]|uniref:UDP-glucose 4-epimerase n=1 Tax=Labilithrix luteola TaxID=1391654 RepID=A0A0K1PJN2_9BACT|nr:SDR family oxidoreductase [Labilithrix luteola]AKU93717.1 UDP-glucose 4-epimerase [Labilithrix luteola]